MNNFIFYQSSTELQQIFKDVVLVARQVDRLLGCHCMMKMFLYKVPVIVCFDNTTIHKVRLLFLRIDLLL